MRTLSQRALNRAVLARQGLLAGHSSPLPRVLSRVCGIQAQYAPSMYVGLWARTEGFERDALTRALERRSVVQATLMRMTIHLVSPGDYWPFALATRDARRERWLKSRRGVYTASELARAASDLEVRLVDGPVTRAEAVEIVGKERFEGVGQWVDMVRVPPSGTWDRRRADLFGLAADWVGPCPEDLSVEAAQDLLVRRYLAAFGPATRKDVTDFTGLALPDVDAALGRFALRSFGGGLVDLPRAPLPDPDAPAPVRFLPTWDALLLVHARRAGVLAEEHRPRIFNVKMPQSIGTFLVDGSVAGTWKLVDGRVKTEPFGRLGHAVARELREEADRLTDFHAP